MYIIFWQPLHDEKDTCNTALSVRVNFYMDSTWYSQLPVTQTSCPLKAILISFQIDFYIILPSITQTHDNLNFFLFPLRVRIIGNRLYTQGVQ